MKMLSQINCRNAFRLLSGFGLASAVREVYIFVELSARRCHNRLEEVEDIVSGS